jgi:hypothetical protein
MYKYNSIDADIREEFEELSGMSLDDSYSINSAWQNLEGGDKKNFGIIKKGSKYLSDHEIDKNQRVENFCKLLIESKNWDYSRKAAGIAYYRAKYYTDFLNISANDRGLPPLWQPKERKIRCKLTEKQVSYIKYLVSKYSTCRIATMYNVNQSTINHIRIGYTWKTTEPAIPIKYIIQSVNQYQSSIKVYTTPLRTIDLDHFLCNENYYISLLEKLRWNDKVKCPFCHSDDLYDLHQTHGNDKWKCANRKCANKFNVKIGTIYQGSKLPMAKWVAAMYLYFKDPSISSMNVARELDCTQKTSHYVLDKIRKNPYNLFFTQTHVNSFINE